MAHNSIDEDPNDIKSNSSLEFNSEDDNFDDFLDDELNPTPMTDEHLSNNKYGSNIPDLIQTNPNFQNQNIQKANRPNSRFQKTNNIENVNDSAYIEPILKKENLNNIEPETVANTAINSLNNSNVSKTASGGLKILNRNLINKNSQNLNSNYENANSNMNNNENVSIKFSNKSEISFPSLQPQNNLNLQQQQNVPLRGFGAKFLLNAENDNKSNTTNNIQSIPGIPVVESESGNFNSSLQSSLFTKNENGSTIINFPPLKKVGQIDSNSTSNTPLQGQIGSSKVINFPPLKNEEQENQSLKQRIQQNQNEQQKEIQNSTQISSINGADQSQMQQPSQIKVSIKPKFLLKQTPQSTGKPQVSFNPSQRPQNISNNHIQDHLSNLQINQQNQTQDLQQNQTQNLQQNQIQNLQQNQIQISQPNQIQNLQQNQIQNLQQNQIQISQQNQIQNLQQNQLLNSQHYQTQNLQQMNQNTQPFINSSSHNQSSMQQINYVMTPTDRVAVSFENKLDLSLSALKRSISSEINSSLRLSHSSISTTGVSVSEATQDTSRYSFSNDRFSINGRLPNSFDSDVDTFLDNLNNELVNAVSFAPLIGSSECSFYTTLYANGISPNASANNTEVLSEKINSVNNNMSQFDASKMNKNSFLNIGANMSFAAEKYASFLSQSIGNVIDENLRPITSGLAASSIVEKQICNEQMKSLHKLHKEVTSLHSLFKTGASQIFEKLNKKIALVESSENEDSKRRRKFNRLLNELRFKRKDLEMQLQRQIEEKEKNDSAFRNLVAKRKQNFLENYTKNETDMKLNKLLKIIENLENELKDESSNRNVNYNVTQNDSHCLNSIDSPKMFSDLLNSLQNGEKILNMNEESMRFHLMDVTASSRWIANSLSLMSRFMQKEYLQNSNSGNRSQLQLQYSPNRRDSSRLMSPRRENRQNSFI